MTSARSGIVLVVIKTLIFNLIAAGALMFATSKQNKNGLIKLILFVVSLSDYLFTFRSESSLMMASAVILISPQEQGLIFPTFTVMAFIESQQDQDANSPLILFAVIAYALLASNFLQASQNVFRKENSLKTIFSSEDNRSTLMATDSSVLEKTITSIYRLTFKYKSHAGLALLVLELLAIGFGLSHRLATSLGQDDSLDPAHANRSFLVQGSRIARLSYFYVALVCAIALTCRHFSKNIDSKGKYY